MEGHGASQAGGERFPTQNRSQRPPQPNAVYQSLSKDELRVLQECNRHSFFYRCVPLAVFSSLGIQWAAKAGYITPHPKWGITFKVVGALAASYVLGKLSYKNKCVEMIMALPNSKLAETLRGNSGRISTEEAMQYIQPTPGSDTFDPNVRDVDTSRTGSSYSQARERERPLLDLSPSTSVPQSEEATQEGSPHRYRSFDDLRRDNRAEFSNRRFTSDGGLIVGPTAAGHGPQQDSPVPPSYYGRDPQPAAAPPPPSASDDFNPGKRFQRKNKYGDPVDE